MMEGRRHLIIRSILAFALLCITISGFSQDDKKYIRKGNREYDKGNFSDAEIMYRKASDENERSPEATFNIGDALYRQEKFEDAGRQFLDNTTQTVDEVKQSAGWYNLGNSLLQANKVQESIDAYKNALKLNPENLAAKYNLGYAQNLLQQQEQQQQQQQQQQQDKDQQQQDKQDKGQNDEQQQDQNQSRQTQEEQQQKEQQEQGISKEDAERLLNALANDEKEIQEKVKREKAARSRSRTLKNW